MSLTEEQRLEDAERALILALGALLNNDVELAKQILEEQIEKTYES
jgi:hypothetical protein